MTVPMRFRQYIQVKAAGSGENPDPAVFCPANGYTKDEYLPDPDTFPIQPPDTDDEIRFIVSPELGSIFRYNGQDSESSGFHLTVYGENNAIVDEVDLGIGSQNYNLPTSGGWPGTARQTFMIKVRPQTSYSHITLFTFGTSGYDTVIEAIYQTPYLKSMQLIAQTNYNLRYIEFVGSCNLVATMDRFLYNCYGIEYVILPTEMDLCGTLHRAFYNTYQLKNITWPASLPANISLFETFYKSGIKKVIFPSMPLLETAYATFREARQVYYIEFTEVCNNLTTLYYFGLYTDSLKTMIFPTEMNALTNLTDAFRYDSEIATIVLPDKLNALTDANNCFDPKRKLRIIQMPTEMNNVANMNYFILRGLMAELVLPSSMPNLSVFGARYCSNLKSITLPTSIPSSGVSFNFYAGGMDASDIDGLFTNLPSVTSGTIDVRNNPGFATCDPTIAQAKGWTVTGA